MKFSSGPPKSITLGFKEAKAARYRDPSRIDTVASELIMENNMLTEDAVRKALAAVKYPGYSRDVVSFGLVKEVAVKQGAVSVIMNLTTSSPEMARQIKAESERVLKELPEVSSVYVEVNHPKPAPGIGAGAQSSPPSSLRSGSS